MKWIGLTGGIASGKSTVGKILKDFGIPVIDADLLSREVMAIGGAAYEKVVRTFGEEMLTPHKTIDRAKLAKRIFSDNRQRQLLESIVHPKIHIETELRRKELKEQGIKIAVNEVPLLFENGLETQYDKVLVVYCSEEQQLQRLYLRERISPSEVLLRVHSQISIEKKKSLASFVIDNTGSLKDLEASVRRALRYLGSSL